jgi:hypothetical protein
MVDLSKVSLGDVIQYARDGAVIVSILVFGWKARAFIQPAIDFFEEAKATMERANKHFTIVEERFELLMENHLKHISQDLAHLSGRNTSETSAEQKPVGKSAGEK